MVFLRGRVRVVLLRSGECNKTDMWIGMNVSMDFEIAEEDLLSTSFGHPTVPNTAGWGSHFCRG
jgi:hypothetical protein